MPLADLILGSSAISLSTLSKYPEYVCGQWSAIEVAFRADHLDNLSSRYNQFPHSPHFGPIIEWRPRFVIGGSAEV